MYVAIGFAHYCIFCSPTYTGNKKSRGGYASIGEFKGIHLYSNGMIISETGKAISHSVLLTASSSSSSSSLLLPPPPSSSLLSPLSLLCLLTWHCIYPILFVSHCLSFLAFISFLATRTHKHLRKQREADPTEVHFIIFDSLALSFVHKPLPDFTSQQSSSKSEGDLWARLNRVYSFACHPLLPSGSLRSWVTCISGWSFNNEYKKALKRSLHHGWLCIAYVFVFDWRANQLSVLEKYQWSI